MAYLVLCTYLLLLAPLSAEEVRGFLYKDDQERWFLTDMPNLRSCCAHKVKKTYLEGFTFDEKEIGKVQVLNGKLDENILENLFR